MNNWRLLLLAVLCTFQPILSEENLFNGRERCFLQRPDSRSDTRFFERQLSTSVPEIRQVKSETRRETRETLGQRHAENPGLRYSERIVTTRNEGFDADIGKSDRIRPNYRIREGIESRERHDGERANRRNIQHFDQRITSRSDRRESQIRDVRQEQRSDIESRIRERSLARSLENHARFTRSEELIRENRRALERDVIRTRDTLSRSTESYNTQNRQAINVINERHINERQVDSEPTRAVYRNVRLHNEDDARVHRGFVRRDLDESRNFRRELKTRSSRTFNRIRSLDLDERSDRRLNHVQRQNLRTESEIRSFQVEINGRGRLPETRDLRRNIMERSDDGFRPSSDRHVRNQLRMEHSNRVRRDDFENTRSARQRQVRENEVESRDFIVRVIREDRAVLRNSNRDADINDRRREHRTSYVRSQRQFASELLNEVRRPLTTRTTRIDGSNKITNDQRVIAMERDNRITISDNERRQSNALLRERNFENHRNIERDNRQRENLENNRRHFNRQETRVTRVTKEYVRQNENLDGNRRHFNRQETRLTREYIRQNENLDDNRRHLNRQETRAMRQKENLDTSRHQFNRQETRNTHEYIRQIESLDNNRRHFNRQETRVTREYIRKNENLDETRRHPKRQETRETPEYYRENLDNTLRHLNRRETRETNLENNRRQFNRQESRETKEHNSRKNMERDSGRRLRMIENIRVDREEVRNTRVTNSGTRDMRVVDKHAREETTRSYRTNDMLSSSRGKSSEDVFAAGFELQHLLYVIQAIYLFGLFVTLPRSKESLKKKERSGVWSNTLKLIKVD